MNLSAKEQTPASEDASSGVRRALSAATVIRVSEGLPHQMFERDSLAKESKREDTAEIGSYRFYTPAVDAKNGDALKRILASAETIQVFLGEKACGGFHPDYAVHWTDAQGGECYAQICFGCHEIIYSDGKNQYRYDLENGPYEELRKELKLYAKKRPNNRD